MAHVVNGRGAELHRLWEDVQNARSAYKDELRGRVESPTAVAWRFRTLEALEAYVDAIELAHFPVPPQVHRELTLLRCLCGPSAARRRG